MRRGRRPRGVLPALLVLVASVGLAGCGGEGTRLSVATGGTGGVYFVYGGGIAEQITEHLDGYEATAEVTSASVDNMFLIADGKSDAVTDLATSREIVVLPTDRYLGPLQQRYGEFYAASKIDPGKYAGVDAEVNVIGVPNYLVVSSSMDDELAYQLTRLLFERQKELGEVHPSARQLKLETAPKVAPLELHPGAKRYYDEAART